MPVFSNGIFPAERPRTLKAVSPVYPASFLFALVKVLFGREVSSASAAGQEMSLVSETKVISSSQFAGRSLGWTTAGLHFSSISGWLSSPFHHSNHLPVTELYTSLCFSVPS